MSKLIKVVVKEMVDYQKLNYHELKIAAFILSLYFKFIIFEIFINF
jgi:hypothetical protein